MRVSHDSISNHDLPQKSLSVGLSPAELSDSALTTILDAWPNLSRDVRCGLAAIAQATASG